MIATYLNNTVVFHLIIKTNSLTIQYLTSPIYFSDIYLYNLVNCIFTSKKEEKEEKKRREEKRKRGEKAKEEKEGEEEEYRLSAFLLL